ncbi:MAG: FimV/HubP family polar landmark protein [Bermanella sp.]
MLRKLAIAIAASGALMSTASVHALGMGDIELDSALNQPLDAHIKLLKAGELEDWEIKPDLASTGEFRKSGIERVFFLNNVRFEIERTDEGVFIKLSTQEAVVEPFLNFLVQVDWPNGRLLREYTLLLDPPVFTQEPSGSVDAPQEEYESSPDESQLESDLPGMGVASAQDEKTEEPAQGSAMRSQPKVVDEPVKAQEPEAPVQQTYKVRTNDTLWEVALKTRPNRKISPQQAMLAIQDLNPDSFINGNINRLKKNQVLRIPSEEQIKARGFREAVSEVAIQNKVISKKKAQLDATRKVEAIDRDQKVKGAELKLLTGGDASSEVDRSASGEVTAATTGDQSKLDNELSLAMENLDKSQRENSDLSTRLDALEEQINTLQRIINLKDEQMVALQAGFSQSAQEAVVVKAPVDEKTVKQVEEVTAEMSGESKPLDNEAQPSVIVAEGKTDLNFSDSKEAQEQPEKQKTTPTVAPESIAEEDFNPVAMVMDNIEVFGGALGALLLTLLLVNRRRKSKESEEVVEDEAQMPDFDGVDSLDEIDDELENELDDEFADLEINSEVDELSEEEPDNLHVDTGLGDSLGDSGDGSDILGEAEIYIAYDRMDQARNLLEKTVEAQPARMDVRVKLLEVLSSIGDGSAFTEHYDCVVATGSDADQEKAAQYRAALGLDGDESTDLDLDDGFGLDVSEDAGSADLDFGGIELGGDDSDLNFDLDGLGLEESPLEEMETELSEFDESLDQKSVIEPSDDELSLEFGSLDLDDSGLLEPSAEAGLESMGIADDLGSNDELSLSDFDADLDFEVPELSNDLTLSGDDQTSDLDVGFELNDELLDIDGSQETLDIEAEGLAPAGDFALDDELQDLDFLASSLDATPESGSASLDVPESDLNELSLDLDTDVSLDSGLDAALDDELDLMLDSDLEEGSLDLGLELENELGAELDDLAVELDEDVSLDDEFGSIDLSDLENLDDEINKASVEELGGDSLDLDDLSEELGGVYSEEDTAETLDINDNLSLSESELDLDLGIDESELPVIEGLEDDLLDELDQLSVDLDVDSEPAEAAIVSPEAGTLDLASLEENDLDLTDLDGDLDFLSGTDESETKLDLARAYIDMDDHDGAKEILQEVIEDGSEQQKQDAGRLMDSLV